MASRKHHKQDSARPTKARSRRMRTNASWTGLETENEETDRTPEPAGVAAQAGEDNG